MNLSFDDHWVDDVAAIIDCDEPAHLYFAGSFIYVHDTDVTAERISQIRRIVVVNRLEPGFDSGWMICVSRERDLLDRLCAIGRPFDEEFARLPFEIVFASFKQISGNLSSLVPDLSRRDGTCGAGHRSAAAGVSSQSVGGSVSIAFLDQDITNREAEFLGD